jgi:REP element-mobilizing transposase RayT
LVTLGEVCERCGLIVHSYVLLSNHYHLLMATPAGDLVAGMRWFQGTYTARFNARHRLAGHLFAGRYKAILVEREEPAYGRVVSDYIHLNPARAGIVNAENPRLRAYRWSSFPGSVGKALSPVGFAPPRCIAGTIWTGDGRSTEKPSSGICKHALGKVGRQEAQAGASRRSKYCEPAGSWAARLFVTE